MNPSIHMNARFALLLAATVAAAGCSDRNDPAQNAASEPATPSPAATPTSAARAMPTTAMGTDRPSAGEVAPTINASFPVAIRGTWRETGDAPPTTAQCNGSANGNIGKVLVVRDESFSIFEEGGRLIAVKERAEGRIRAIFDTTYADTPTRADLTFSVDPGTRMLVLIDNSRPSGSRRTYRRCPA